MSVRNLLLPLALVSSLYADNINQVSSNRSWLDPEAWSNNATPTPNNDYFLLQGTGPPDSVGQRGLLYTTPAGTINSGQSTDFGGRSLEVSQSEVLAIRQTGTNVASIRGGAGNLTLRGGTLAFRPQQRGSRPVLDVNRFELDNVSTTARIQLVTDTQATIDGELRGGGDLSVSERRNGNVSDASLTFTQVSSNNFTGNISVRDDITLDFDSDVSFRGKVAINNGASLRVDQVLRFRSGNLSDSANGTVPDGIYVGASLDALGTKYINSGGAIIVGSNQVLPTFTVTTLVDETASPGESLSLREALALSPIGIIDFDPSLDGGTISLDAAQGPLRIRRSVVITAAALSNGIVIDGGSNGNNSLESNETRCFIIDDGSEINRLSVTMRGLTIQNGVTSGVDDFQDTSDNGANVYCREALTLDDCRILNGRVAGSRVEFGGLFGETGSRLTLRNSVFSGNRGGAIGFNSEAGSGESSPLLNINRCEVSSNSGDTISIRPESGSDIGGAVSITESLISDNNGRGITSFGVELNVHACTISNNRATTVSGDGGGILYFSTAGLITNGVLGMTVSQSTIVGNTASRDGGGIFQVGPNNGPASFTSLITGCTIVGNTAEEGGGVGNAEIGAGSRLQIKNSIIAGNIAGSSPDVSGGPTASGVNFIGNPSSDSGFRNGTDLSFSNTSSTFSTLFRTTSGGEPLLTDNGGPTPTIQLITGSPAFNAGSDNTFATDQRGAPRRSSAQVDIGAVEFTNVRFVTTLEDELDDISKEGSGLSLREAIRDIGGDREAEIFFDPSLNGGVIRLIEGEGFGQLHIRKALKIDARSLPDGIVIDGGSNGDDTRDPGEVRCFVINDQDINTTLDVRLMNLTIQNGFFAGQFAGANVHSRENLRLLNCRILNGRAIGDGGTGGGIFSERGKLIMEDCFVSGNRTTGANAHGGGLYVEDGAEIVRSTFSENSVSGADASGGGIAVPANNNGVAVELTRCTVERNTTNRGPGAGVSNDGGFIIYEHCSIVENTGEGIFSTSSAENTLRATVVRDNSGGDVQGESSSEYQSSGNCIVGTGNRISEFSAPEISSAPLLFEVLGDAGGLTPVRLPLAGSVVINRGLGSTNTTDQTGFRTVGIPDVGAVEFRGFLVTTLTDELNNDTLVSLREAFRDVTPEFNQIFFDPALAGGTIRISPSLGALVIDQPLVLDVTSLPNGITIDGRSNGDLVNNSNESRCLSIGDGNDSLFDVTLRGLTIQNGVASSGSNISNQENLILEECRILNGRRGSGISSNGILTMRDCQISDHRAVGTSSNDIGAGLHLRGVATVERCTFANNSGAADGGAIGVNQTSLTLIDSHITGNVGRSGGGLTILNGNATVAGTTFSNNQATGSIGDGGAVDIDGQNRTDHQARFTRCPFSGNSSNAGSAGAIAARESLLNLTHCTIVGNTAPEGEVGGVEISFQCTANIKSSILRDNSGGDIGNIAFGTVVSLGRNIVGTGNRVSVFSEVEQNTDPILLSPLGDFGGLTPTHVPLEGSPAIDAADFSDSTTDQRGFPIIGVPDIGATESEFTIDFLSDVDKDGLSLLLERAIGTDPNSPNFGASELLSFLTSGGGLFNSNGELNLIVGRGSNPVPGTVVIIERSTTLEEDSFEEIYRFNSTTGNASTPDPENFRAFAFNTTLRAIEENPAEQAFYRLVVRIEP